MQNDETKKTKSALKKILILVFCWIIAGGFILFATLSQNNELTIIIKDSKIKVEIANSSQKRKKGLSKRSSLDNNSGMLFVYDKPGDYGFWMRDTLIPLDMIWISSDKTITHIESNIQPNSYPNVYRSPVPSQYILEVAGEYAKNHNIRKGDKVTFDHIDSSAI
jgi:uncharacterized membrane protein (UPF0127 family)